MGTNVAPSLAGPFLCVCALLAIAGLTKMLRPAPVHAAVRALGLRIPRSGVVAFGIVEVGAGVAGALWGGIGGLVVAGCYGVLTVFAVALLRRAPATPCACLGSSTATVTRTHVAVNVAAVGVAIAAATGGPPLAQISGHWLEGAVFAVLVACAVKLATLTLETLPDLVVATKEGTA